MVLKRFCLAAMLSLAACGGSRPGGEGAELDSDKAKLIDALTLFVEAVQGDRFDLAMGYVTSSEKARITEGSGVVSPPMRRRLRALRLSTLANQPGVRLEGGKLDGIYRWLPNIEHVSATERGELPPPLP